MDESEMVRKVAKALCLRDHHKASHDPGRLPRDEHVMRHWPAFVADARTAIEAMREPTEEMELAADDPFHEAWKFSRERSLRLHGKEAYASAAFSLPIWRAMIDAALEKQPS